MRVVWVERQLGRNRLLEFLPISLVIGKDSLAVIAPTGTAVGRPTATARRLVDAREGRRYALHPDATSLH